MEKQEFITLLQEARKVSEKRNFSQSFDLIINLKNINLKKEEERINLFMNVPHERGKKVRITALVGSELEAKAKKCCDHVVMDEQFRSLDKKAIKKIAAESDFFIAQSTIMPKIAATFGKILGPRGLMPNPKSGCVVPPTADLTLVTKHLQTLIRLETKNEFAVKTRIGTEAMKDEDVADNAVAIFNTILHTLPQEKNNIKSVVIKTTMGKPVLYGGVEE